LTSLSQGKKPSGYVTGGYSPRGASPAPGSEGRSTPAGEGSRTGADTPPADIGEGTLSGENKHRVGRAGLSPAYSPREAEKERGGERANSSHRRDGVSPSPMFYDLDRVISAIRTYKKDKDTIAFLNAIEAVSVYCCFWV